MSQKLDGFLPRRGSNVDGFLTVSGQKPRRSSLLKPAAKTVPPVANPPRTLPRIRPTGGMDGMTGPGQPSAPYQGRQVGFADTMPKQSSVIHNSTSDGQGQAVAAAQSPTGAAELPGLHAAQQPYSSYAPALPPKKTSRRERKAAKKAAVRAGHSPKSKVKRVAKIFGIFVLVLVLALGARFYKDVAKLTGNNNPLSLLGVFNPSPLKNDDGRVNILVAGNSADDLGHDGGELTDSIMVMSINTRNNTAMMLSIPRDLWVELPSGGHGKINSVYPESGMSGLKETVSTILELPIHYTALVNYTAFKDLVDAVGGITITIDSDDPRGIYDPSLDYTSRTCCALAKYPNGQVTLNGKQALNLARARGDAYGSYGFPQADFDRTNNQRKMLLAIKSKASSASVVANPFKVSNLVDAVGSNVRTDLQISEIQTLYYYSKKVDNSKIDSYNINTLKGENTTMLANFTSADGQSALIPAAGIDDFSLIAAQVERLFSAGPLVKENASVVLLNATDSTGLAKLQSNKLSKQGVNVIQVGDAPQNQTATTIIDNSGGKKPNTLASLKSTYNASVVTDSTLLGNYPNADFIVLLGQNAVPKATDSN